MKYIFGIVFLLIFVCCKSVKTVNNEKVELPIGKPHKTMNKYIPYIYEKGFDSFYFQPVHLKFENFSNEVNQLRFNNVLGINYTQNVMYEKFGKWDKELFVDSGIIFNGRPLYNLILIWENRNLVENSDKKYTVFCSGKEAKLEMYSSVIIIDEQLKRDALSEDNPNQNKLKDFFFYGIPEIKSSDKFNNLTKKLYSEFLKK